MRMTDEMGRDKSGFSCQQRGVIMYSYCNYFSAECRCYHSEFRIIFHPLLRKGFTGGGVDDPIHTKPQKRVSLDPDSRPSPPPPLSRDGQISRVNTIFSSTCPDTTVPVPYCCLSGCQSVVIRRSSSTCWREWRACSCPRCSTPTWTRR